MAVVALIVAAGRGERLGADGPKAFVELGGTPMVHWSIAALREVNAIETIVLGLGAQGARRRRAGRSGARARRGAGSGDGRARGIRDRGARGRRRRPGRD